MAVVTVSAAKTQLSKLIARAEAGEEVIIARRDLVSAASAWEIATNSGELHQGRPVESVG
jgi:hypothetical protein